MSDAVITDLYEATMALSYLRRGMTAPATFSLFVRELPPERGFLVAAGISAAVESLSAWHIDEEDVDVFAAALRRPRRQVEPLRGLRFTGDVWAVPEGRIVLAGEPLLEVTAPLPQAQLVETFLLNQVTYQTMIAAKAARCVLAAGGRPVVDFSLRRAHGAEAGMHVTRAGALVGFAATSSVAAAARFGIRATGTMAHSYIEAFGDEEAAFRAFAQSNPGPVTLLVDTYDTERGVRTAAQVLHEIGPPPGCAIRLDSGGLGALAARARHILDAADLSQVQIIVSGGLDEYAIEELIRADAPIDVFAVGTKVGTSYDAPLLDSAYKLVEYAGRPVMKLSEGKATAPGAKQVYRCPGYHDILARRSEKPPPEGEPLLAPMLIDGVGTTGILPDTIETAHRRFRRDLAALPEPARRIRHPFPPKPRVSVELRRLTNDLRSRLAPPPFNCAGGSPARHRKRPARQRKRARIS